jgi:alpha-mannosidase
MDHLHFVVHTHWDREWYEPFQRMRARLVAMTDRMLRLVEDGAIPYFHFDGQTIVLDDYVEMRPQNARRIAKLVRTGKIQIGPWYVLADSFLVSGEALIRNLEIGGAIARRFGPAMQIGYLPDQFGHIAQMPQILTCFGLKTAVVWRGVGREITRNRFAWEALDGSEIFTVYLPYGYSNGASLPLDSADLLLQRARDIAAREREFAAGAPILVMNGTDHAEPDPRLASRIEEIRGRDEMSFDIGTLEGYVKRLSELPSDGMQRHRGELRSPARAHLLPGVTSARTWIKQRDFLNCYLLERIADPMAALAVALGCGEDLQSFLDAAWKLEIQNHPHDSICGCSVDQVHQDMSYRFDQAAMLGEIVVRKASRAILGGGPAGAGEPAIAVFNPTLARRALVTGEVEIPDPDVRYAVAGPNDATIPAAIDVTRAERAFATEMPARDFKNLVAGLSSAEVMGRFVNRFELRQASAGGDAHPAGGAGTPAPLRFELDLFLSRSPLADVDIEGFKRMIASEISDDAALSIRAMTAARAAVSFVADDLMQAGFSSFRLVPEDGATTIGGQGRPPHYAQAATPSISDSIENEYFRLRPTSRGLAIEDLAHDKRLELYFEDDGDRGDEYNFDPVPGAATIAEPASLSARMVERGAARSRLAQSLVYGLPASLAPDRRARAESVVEIPIELVATLYAGLDRIDFDVTIDNRVRDHRLRAALSTPISASESVSDTSFGVIRRPLDPTEPPGTEDIYPTRPHRTFAGVESDELSAAIVSRGLYEAEVRRDAGRATILLTLLRCIGWLSRSDLATRRGGAGPEMETPGAQEIGAHRFEFAVTTWRGPYEASSFIERAQAYAFPPRVFAAQASSMAGRDARLAMLCRCDNPLVGFSTARASKRANGCIVRVFSASPIEEKASFSFGDGRRARVVDLAGRPAKGIRLKRTRDGVEMKLRPFQIVTFEVRESGG